MATRTTSSRPARLRCCRRPTTARWCYKAFEDLIQKAKTTSDQAERTKLYEQAQVIFKDRRPGRRSRTRWSDADA